MLGCKRESNCWYIHQKVKETNDKHRNITKEIHNCTKTLKPLSKESEAENHLDVEVPSEENIRFFWQMNYNEHSYKESDVEKYIKKKCILLVAQLTTELIG